MRFAIYTANRAGSINIEVEAEMMFTGKSREDVLARLHRVYQAEELPAEEDDRRRECRRRVAIGKVLEESGIEMSNRETVTNWNYMFQYPQLVEPYLEEPFVEASSEVLKDLGNANTWGIEDGVPAGADPEETFPYNTDTNSAFWEEVHQKEWILRETEMAETDIAETDIEETDIAETDIAETDIEETDMAETDIAETDIAEIDIAEIDIAEIDIAETGILETAIPEMRAQATDQPYPKETQRTVPNIDPTFPSPNSLPLRSQETFNIKSPSSNTSPVPNTPEPLAQNNPTTMTAAELNPPTVHETLDIGNGAAPAFAASTVAGERARLLTFSPSMHECLKW